MAPFQIQALEQHIAFFARLRLWSRAMSSLLDRLKAVQKVSQKSEKPRKAASEYSLDELGRMTVAFGVKARGKTFLEMWNTDQQWVKWVVAHLRSSRNYDHQLFIHFVSLKVERLELTNQKVDVVTDLDDETYEIAEMAAELSQLADLVAELQTKVMQLAAKRSGSQQWASQGANRAEVELNE